MTLLMPNLNTLSLIPMGDMAGLASSLTSSVRLGFGSILGTIAAARVSDSVTPFAVAAVLFATATAVTSVLAVAGMTRPD